MMLELDTSAKTDLVPIAGVRQDGAAREFTREFLLDRIQGGWVGMLIGAFEALASGTLNRCDVMSFQ